MKIEILQYYEIDKSELRNKKTLGTMHIKLPDTGIELLGIIVSKINKGYFFSIPFKRCGDKDQKNLVQYPCFVFSDEKKQKDFIDSLKIVGTAYMNKITETLLEMRSDRNTL